MPLATLSAINPSAFGSLGGGGIGMGFGFGTGGGNAAGAIQSAARAQRQGELEQDVQAKIAAQAPTLDFAKQKFATQQGNRQQLFRLLGLTPRTVGEGGLLGNTFFQSVLGNTLPDVVGGVTGAIPGVGQPGSPSSPGFRDSPTSPGLPGGQPGGLFGQQIAGRGQLGQQIQNLLSGFGESERNRIEQAQTDFQNTALARLESRGLGGSNLATNVMEQAQQFGSEQLGALEDRLTGQRVGALQQFGEGLFGDVGQELDRRTTTRGQTMSLLSNLLGSALSI